MSFQQGLSGLNATSKSLEVIGNNIANANTYGAKASRAEFADMYAAALSSTGSIGIGTRLASVAQQFGQGNITTTSNKMDLAINGNGFFQVQNSTGATDYTRNGQFSVNRDGWIVNGDGLKLLVQPWNDTVQRADGDAVPKQLEAGLGAPVATGLGKDPSLAGVQLSVNLKASADVIAVPIDFAKPATYNYSTSQTLYDGQGTAMSMTYYFQKTAVNTWDVYGTVDGAAYDGGSGLLTTTGQLTFDAATGKLDAVGLVNAKFTPPTTVGTLAAFPFDFIGTTQFAATDYSISTLRQDGYAAGELTDIQFDASGVVRANYSNGRTANLGQVQLADFANRQGLQPLGGNLWAATYASGDPTRGSPGTGSLGKLQNSALEESNVDLTGELVNMITAQRLYQANAQTIKTQDQVMQTLVNLR